MTKKPAARRSGCGTTCGQCGEALIAPEWSECVSERHVRNRWRCGRCGAEFETSTYFDGRATPALDRPTLEEFLPSLLVA